MDWCNGLSERVQRDVPLAGLTRFGLGGRARYMFSPRDEAELSGVVRSATEAAVPLRVLGGGANVLIRDDGFDGLVIRLDAPSFTAVRYEGSRVIAGGGADLMKLARDCAYRGLAGLECMAGIPGTVGGAVRMNAGGRFGEIASVVESVRLVDRAGRVEVVKGEELGFGYRRSNVGDRTVVEAVLRLESQPAEKVKQRFHEIWRVKSESQPMADHSAGCMFKNPPGDSAGRLIDQAGLKGAEQGRARVSERHANFIVADAGASAADVYALAERVRAQVLELFGEQLEYEIDVW